MTRPRARTTVGLVLLGVALLGICLYWNRISLGGPLGQAPAWVRTLALPISAAVESVLGPIELDPPESSQPARVRQLVWSWTLAAAVYFLAVGVVLRAWPARRPAAGPRPPATDPEASSPEPRGLVSPLDVILAFAVLFRIVLVFSPPLLETDPKRYLWDGASLTHGVNPYQYAPLEVLAYREGELGAATDAVRRDLETLSALSREPCLAPHFRLINHKNVATVYPPVAQGVFALGAWLAPGEVMVLKALVALLDVGILLWVLHFLGALGRPREWALLYGWCPLALKEYAGTGHYDPAATFFMLASLWMVLKGRRGLAGLLAGLAVSAKFFPVVVVFVLARRYGLRGLAACAATVATLYAPFLGASERILQSLGVFASQWIGNASIFTLVRAALRWLDEPAGTWVAPLSSMVAAKAVLSVVLLVVLIALARARADSDEAVLRNAFLALGVAFVVSPVQNPWYATWVMPFAAVHGSVAWTVLSGTMVAYYAFFSSFSFVRAGPWGVPIDLRWPEYVPFFALLAAERGKGKVAAPLPARLERPPSPGD